MELREKWLRGQQGYESARIQFILTELDLAITFAERALSTEDMETKQRNSQYAKQAYDAAAHFIGKNLPGGKTRHSVLSRISRADGLFKELDQLP